LPDHDPAAAAFRQPEQAVADGAADAVGFDGGHGGMVLGGVRKWPKGIRGIKGMRGMGKVWTAACLKPSIPFIPYSPHSLRAYGAARGHTNDFLSPVSRPCMRSVSGTALPSRRQS